MKMKILEAASYLALLTVCVIATVKLLQFHPQQHLGTTPAIAAAPTSVSGRIPVDLTSHKKWLILVLSTECHFCVESIPFHQELQKAAQNSGDLGLMAVFPQARSDVEKYEAAHKFFPSTVVADVGLDQLQVRGTPTLLLVNQQGTVLKHWEGRLSESKQQDVRTELGISTN
jgi:hypothetical protein